jgi:uncharacterized protein Yka (UPF0111/DUF47 family)
MPGFFQRLMPRDGSSSSCSRNITENIVAGAQAFTKMLSHYAGVPEQVQIIKAIEHNSEEITHQILRKLNHFAPFYGPPPPFGISLPLSLLEPPSPRP